MRGGTLIGKRLYKGVRERVIVPTIDTNPPVPVSVPSTLGGAKYQKALDSLEKKVLDGTYGKETAPRSVEGALFLDSETGEPEVRKLDPAMLSEMGLPPPPRKYINAWCCPFADPKDGYACTPLTVKQGGYAPRIRACQPNRGAKCKAAMVRHMATAHKSGAYVEKNSGAYAAYVGYNREAGFEYVVSGANLIR
tara:strand:- start:2325 stop:2906 length:582 start_codon:yes stop_codon:yes gene_type:complete